MSRWVDLGVRTGARALRFPPGMGPLISGPTRRRLLISVIGSVMLAALDTAGVLALVPMMQYIAGVSRDSGALGKVNDLLGEPTDSVLIGALAALIAATFIVKDVLALFFRRWQLHFMAVQEVEVSTRLLRGYLVGPYAWHLARNTSDKLWTVEGAVSMGYSSSISAALGALTEVLTVALIFGGLLFVSPVPTVAAVLYFAVAAYSVTKILRLRLQVIGGRTMATDRASAKSSLQALGAYKEIKLRRAHEPFVADYSTARLAGAHARASAMLLNELPRYLLEIVFVLGIGLLAFVVTTTSGEKDGVVLLGVFVAASTRILPSCVRLVGIVGAIRVGRAPLRHLVREFAAQQAEEARELSFVTTERTPEGDVSADGLTFAYEDEPDALVLRGVDAIIREGQSTALVGSSGAGKSTFVDILLGLHRPRDGRLTAGGIDIFANLPGWQAQLAVVPQDVYLLDETLRDNIVFDEEHDPHRLRDAVSRAQLEDLVSSLPDGLDTEVGERGVRLSGGQRQRIGIARALYRHPKLLILDEATSALDNETEHRLTETISHLQGTMTILIVAHRLSTVRDCDSLIFMSQGRVAAQGTFDQVRAVNAEFASLVRLGSLQGRRGPESAVTGDYPGEDLAWTIGSSAGPAVGQLGHD